MVDKAKILDFIRKNDFTTTQQICMEFGVSESTARRVLSNLSETGKITRLHGGAMPASVNGSATEFQIRNAINKEQKIAIAKAASGIIHDYSTVILLGGTTVCEMCQFIQDKNVTVVTNSMLVLNGLKYSRNVRLIILGGLYNYQEEEVGGLLANKGLNSMRADYLFMGTSGFDEKYGFSTTNAAVDLYINCIETSVNTCVLADSSKYMRGGATITARLDQVNYLFTDSGLDMHAREAMAAQNIKVVVAEENS